jgi:hypothetical protein
MALKFVPIERKKELPWKDGAIILLERPTMKQRSAMIKEARKAGCKDDESLGTYMTERHIVGWKEIVVADPDNPGKTKPLEFTDQHRTAVFEQLMFEAKMRDAIIEFMGGGLGNLKSG